MADVTDTIMRIGASAAIGYIIREYGRGIKSTISSILPAELQQYGNVITGLLIGGLIKYFAEDYLGDWTDVIAASVAAGFAADPPEDVNISRTQTQTYTYNRSIYGGVIG
jgi:hypothetical protein